MTLLLKIKSVICYIEKSFLKKINKKIGNLNWGHYEYEERYCIGST